MKPTALIAPICCAFSFSSVVSVTAILSQVKYDAECGRDLYGSPKLEDCHTLLEQFADARDNGLRFFDEEQTRSDTTGSWPGIGEIVGSSRVVPIVQLPRYYTLRTSSTHALCRYEIGEPFETNY